MAVNMTIGGFTFGVSTNDSDLLNAIEKQYSPFLNGCAPDIDIRVEPGNAEDVGTLTEEAGGDHLPEWACIAGRQEVRDALPDEARISHSGDGYVMVSRAGEGMLRADSAEASFWLGLPGNLRCFDSMLRMTASILFLERGAFLVHGSGVVRDGSGILSAGLSGAGKTSVARLVPPEDVLCDEVVLVRRQGDTFMLCSTPFWGEMTVDCQEAREIAASTLYLLSREYPPGATKVSSARAAAELLRHIVFFCDEDGMAGRLLELCTDFCASVECRHVNIVPDENFWPKLAHDVRESGDH